MATILNDEEIKGLIGKVIIDGDPSCIRPNCYVLRLGQTGEFLNCNKEFNIGGAKKGIKVQPGHSVALTAFETIDLRREVVRQIYPDHDIHAFISPSTDLSREGIVAPTTQVDAGYNGTLNWTLTNTSNEVRRFLNKEKLFRIIFFKLGPGETPIKPYDGDYQGKKGYVRSERKGAPAGMRENEWEDSRMEGGPETQLENLIKSGYPWNLLGQRLQLIDNQFQTVTNEYGDIKKAIDGLKTDVGQLRADWPSKIEEIVKRLAAEIHLHWSSSWWTTLGVCLGLVLTIVTNDAALKYIKTNGVIIGLLIMAISILFKVFTLMTKKK